MYKCCWNCINSAGASCETRKRNIEFFVSKRFCCAPYPISERSVNPFQQRYCKQFATAPFYGGHAISKQEAQMLEAMTLQEKIKYWGLHSRYEEDKR